METTNTAATALGTSTLRVRGRDYTVTPHDRTNSVTGVVEKGYRLTGKRGASYFTMRNVKRPELMFVVSHALTNAMQGVWLTDAAGFVVIVSQ